MPELLKTYKNYIWPDFIRLDGGKNILKTKRNLSYSLLDTNSNI